MKKSEQWMISTIETEDNFRAMRTDYQEHHERVYYGYRIGIEESIKTDTKN
jgi:hypothetical protein